MVNPAMMELGALICTAKSPSCDQCPVLDRCAWVAAGRPEADYQPKGQAWAGTDRQLRGAMLAVPRGELEAARAFGMARGKVLRRIWLPRAFRIALPTFAGEVVLQLKATPIVFSVTVMDLYGAAYKVRQDTLLVYEPLGLVAMAYVALTFLITYGFHKVETAVPSRR